MTKEELTDKNEELEAEISELKNTIEELNAVVAQLETEINLVETELEAANEDYAESEEEVINLAAELDKVEILYEELLAETGTDEDLELVVGEDRDRILRELKKNDMKLAFDGKNAVIVYE